jgi:oligopeptide/dipeptide ABC transporter ATP-binding protein
MKALSLPHQKAASVLVETVNLKKHYKVKTGLFARKAALLKAVDGVNLAIREGETLGLVGESGCGKSTLGRLVLRLESPTEGKVLFDGVNIYDLDKETMRKMRRQMQLIFQDPYSSLNPKKTVGWLIGEPLAVHHGGTRKEIREQVLTLMEEVGLQPDMINRYPHEFSGGQRQRITIARALSLKPRFIVADEPASALDVSIQAQIITLLENLQARFNLTYLIISHDLRVIYYMSDRIAVMYLGKIMDLGPKEEFLSPPQHPYTEALVASAPRLERRRRKSGAAPLQGEIPSPVNPPSGCLFHTRCPYAEAVCQAVIPPLEEKSPGHYMACHFR